MLSISTDADDASEEGTGVREYADAACGAIGSDTFWNATEPLKHVLEFARSRRVGPYAMLGVVLARVVASIPPNVVIPPLTGGRQSLNLFVGLVGASGQGKGGAEAAGREAFSITKDGSPIQVAEVPVGSGEGIAKSFADDTKSVVFSVAEVDTFAALFKRQGSTLESELRKLYSGEMLGFQNASAETRCTVPAHTYRASLIVGVQPGRARVLLDGSAGGTPQRFLWLPVTDPGAPDAKPARVGPAELELPTFDADGFADLVIPESVVAEIDECRLQSLRGQMPDALDGHAHLTRLKVAIALGVVNRRGGMGYDEWVLAGHLMAVSTSTRNALRGEAVVGGVDIPEVQKLLCRVSDNVVEILRKAGGSMKASEVRKKLRVDVREYFDLGLVVLIRDRRIHTATDAQRTMWLHLT